MGALDVRFNQVNGVPLMYWRPGGPGNETQSYFYADNTFHTRLGYVVSNLEYYGKTYGGLGNLVHIVTAGIYVNKPGGHGKGQAFDLDRVKWANGTCTPYLGVHASATRKYRRRYLATDAICRRWSRYVLDGYYNYAHRDHIHFDLESLPERIVPKVWTGTRWSGSSMDTKFVQKCCNDFNGSSLSVDGLWGSGTEAAYLSLKSNLGTSGNPKTSTYAYRNFLGCDCEEGVRRSVRLG